MKSIAHKKNIKHLVTSSFLILICSFSLAQDDTSSDEKKKFTFGGSVDGYYRTNLSATDTEIELEDGTIILPQSPGTAYVDETGFALGMANLIVDYEGDKVGAVADLAFGPRGVDAAGDLLVNQLFVYWNVSEKTKLTMGRFYTYLGYEMVTPVENFHYSTSRLFTNGPFHNIGLKADFQLSEDFNMVLVVMNVADTNNNLTGVYAAGAQFGYSGQYLNFYYDGGEAQGFEVDYTGGFDLTDTFYLGINAAYADDEGEGFHGVALYPKFKASESFGIGLRGEYFGRRIDGLADDPSVIALTLTGSYTIENLTIKPEFRLDSWGNDFEPYFDNDRNQSNSLSSFALAAIYAF